MSQWLVSQQPPDGSEIAPISPALFGGEADTAVAEAVNKALDSHHSAIKSRASSRTKEDWKALEELTDNEDWRESRRVGRTGSSLLGWWYCCRDRCLNNPSLCERHAYFVDTSNALRVMGLRLSIE